MKKLLATLLFITVALCSSRVQSQNFFDTSDATTFFNLSGRIGFNTSNRTFPANYYNLWNHNSWGTGFNIGVLANLNFKEYLTIQPGIFYDSRSGDYAYLTEYLDSYNREQTHYEMGHWRTYSIEIPLMLIWKFNLSEKIKWSVEFGPYFQLFLTESGQNNVSIIYRDPQSSLYSEYTAEHQKYDAGIKAGTGLQFFNHYYIGVHYLAGFMDSWKLPSGGRNKSWQFSIGYDF